MKNSRNNRQQKHPKGHLTWELANTGYKTMVILFKDIKMKLKISADHWKL